MATQYNDARNLREKAERRIAALKKQKKAAQSKEYKKQLQRDIRRLQDAARSTRTYSTKTGKRMRTAEQVSKGIAKLKSLVEEYPLLGVEKRNRSFALRLNLANNSSLQGPTRNAGRTLGEEMSGLTSDEVKVFYRATQHVWDNGKVPIEKRNEAIEAHYKDLIGTRDLQRIFDYVLSDQRQQDVLKAKDIVDNPDKYTDAEKKWAYDILQDNESEIRYQPVVNAAASADLSPVAPM